MPLDELYDTLAATLGTFYVNDFNKYGRTWQVLMSAEPAYRKRPDDVGAVYVRSEQGRMVPLASLAKVNYSSGPDSLDRFNNLPSVKIFGATQPGFSSGQAIERMEKIARETLPPEFSFDWGGASFQEKRSGGTSILALGLAALMVFLILAAQYDRWSLPLAVMLALPFGTFGALAAIAINNLLPMPYYLAAGRAVAAGPALPARRHRAALQRRLLPDRPGDAARPRREERHPDRRVRRDEEARGAVDRGRRGGSGAPALPPDPDDLARLHPGRDAARVLQRRRRRARATPPAPA